MTEKVKVTKEQAEALDKAKGIFNLAAFIDFANEESKPMNNHSLVLRREFDKETLLQAVFYGYDVEPQFKVGDWVIWETKFELVVVQIKNKIRDTGISFGFNKEEYHSDYIVRHATPLEIKAEKERQLWKSIDREVGEFREGDTAVTADDYHYTGLDLIKKYYIKQELKGFYPVESFISFGEVKDESN